MQAKIKSHNKHLEKVEGQPAHGGQRKHFYETREIYTLVFENAGDAIFWADVETGLIINCNRAAEILLERDKSEIIGSHQSTLHPLHMAEHYSQMFRSHIESKGAIDAEAEVVTKSGQTKCVLISASIIAIHGQKILQEIFRDITERKEKDEKLRWSEEKYRSLVEKATAAMVTVDSQGRLVFVNEAGCKMIGYSEKELIGSPFADLIHPEDKPSVLDRFAMALDGVGTSTPEFRVVHRDGHVVYCCSSPTTLTHDDQVVGFSAIIHDISERRNMEQALRRSEEHFKALTEHSYEAIAIVNSDGTTRYQSLSVGLMLGYAPEDLVGRNVFELVHPDDVQRSAESFAELVQNPGASIILEVRYKHKDGSWRRMEGMGRNLLNNPAVAGIVVNYRDITERKRMEEELRQRERDYSMLLESTHEGIIVFDAETLKVVFGNRRAALMFGFDPVLHDAIGINMLDQVHPEDREIVLKGLAEDLYTSERRKRYEVRVNAKDGKEVWVSALATRIEFRGRLAVLLSLKDISDEKRAEEALEEYREDYATLVENLSDAVFKFKDGVVVWCNDRVKDIYGYSKDELIGMDASFFIPADRDPFEFIKSVYAVMKKEGCYRGSAKAKTKSGGTVDVEYSISQLPSKHHIELVTVARDVTERRRLEEQIQLAGRLAAVGELAAGVAHELNNPLAAIQGFAQLLTKSNDLNEAARKDLDALYREAKRAGKITQNLLSFARKHKPGKQLISINEALEKTLELRAHQMKVNNIELWAQLQPDLPMTMADFYQMQQVFINIIINAEQAMIEAHGKGRLSIQTRKVDEVIQTTFTDDGPGILEDNLTRIFDPFFTTKEPGKGTGLGLSICYGIVKAHGGQILVRSKPGEGATFVVEMPIVRADEPG